MFKRSPVPGTSGIRRLLAVLLAVLLGTAALAACGSEDSSDDATPAKDAAASAGFPARSRPSWAT